MNDTDVLVVGAGPTGLVLALWLTRLGVRVRVVDKAPAAAKTSRAVGVQARTLEFYRQVGLADEIVSHGVRTNSATLWVRGKAEGHIAFGSAGEASTPFPYLLVYPQDEHEALLASRLAALGVHVERATELVGFDDEGAAARVTARLRRPDGSTDVCRAAYLAGCDGARSRVREELKIAYAGGTYAHVFYVADVQASGPAMNGELHIALDDGDFFACFPLEGTTRARLIGDVLPDAGVGASGATSPSTAPLDWNAVNKRALDRMQMNVTHVNWFSTYRVHHRVASAFRAGRCFLLGDAAHVHSPVGGQGMNTGIGDAVNLAWKLAAVLKGRSHARLLDTFEAERIPFARRLVRTTDRIFSLVTSNGRLASAVRLGLAAPALTTSFRSKSVQRFFFRTISQTMIHYRRSPLSEGHAGGVRGGDRLPWVPSPSGDNFDALRSLDWQVHVHGDASPPLRTVCERRRVPLHAFPWSPQAERAGVARDAAYLVRPDGYVALAAPSGETPARLEAYLGAHAA